MSMTTTHISEVLDKVSRRNAGEPEFLQAVREVFESLAPVLEQKPAYVEHRILERRAAPGLEDKQQLRVVVQWLHEYGPWKPVQNSHQPPPGEVRYGPRRHPVSG